MTDNVAVGLYERLVSEQLLSEEDLPKAQAISTDDPTQWAKEMIEAGLLTRWQASRIVAGKGPLTLGPYILLDRIPILGGSELFAGWTREEGVARWLEILPEGAEPNHIHLSPRTDVAVPSGTVHTIDGRSVIDHGAANHGTCVASTLKKGVRWERTDTAVLLRDACKALKALHGENKAIGRITPTSFVKAEVGYRLATWGALSSDRTAEDPYTAPEAKAPQPSTPAADVYSLGVTALVLAFGTSSPAKVQAKSRFDQIVLKMVEADPAKRPNVAAAAKALDEWLASKQPGKDPGAGVAQAAEPEMLDMLEVVEETTASTASASDSAKVSKSKLEETTGPAEENTVEVTTTPAIELPDFMKELAGPSVNVIPKIEAEQRFAADVVIAPTQVKLHKAELPKHNLAMTIVVYSVVGLVTLGVCIGAGILAWNRMYPAPVVAQANGPNPNAPAANNGPNQADNQPAPDAPITDGVADSNPPPLVDIEDPTIPVVVEEPVVAPQPNGGSPFGRPGNNSNDTDPQVAVGAPNGEGESGEDPAMNNGGGDTAVAVTDPPVTETPQPAPPTPETPYVPAFQDLAKAVDLPVVGDENWQNEVVLGKIHLQPRDLLVVEIKGGNKAFRDTTTFTSYASDGGTAVNAYDLFAVTGPNREKIARLWVDGEDLKFKYYPEAESAASANYLRNCHLRMRTGVDVGGLSLRRPIALPTLTMADRRLNTEVEVKIDFMPDVSAVQFRVLPLADTFPEYAFRDAASDGAIKNGKIDVIFGGKFSEAMFLQLGSRYSNRLTLSVSAFYLVGQRAVPFRTEEVERNLQAAQLERQRAVAQITAIDQAPAEQRGGFQNQRALAELARQNSEMAEKQLTDTLTFVDSLKGQALPVAIYFMADEYKVYLGTVDGNPLD